MESDAHRRSLGVSTLDPATSLVQLSPPPVLASLVVNRRKKRLVPSSEGKNRAPKKKRK